MSLDADWYVRETLARVPRVLTLQDRDPSSPTFGSFDRNWWHYRTQDFPSGMYQELALVLAQVWAWELPGNAWRGESRIRELAIAGVRAAARSAHADGSCDDYFPYERALGATAFAAAAHARVIELTHCDDADLLAFQLRRVRWLVGRSESGRLSNHQALVALAAARTARVCAAPELASAARERLATCLSWQHDEGWFQEYEGADLGYQSLTISFLAALQDELHDPALDAALERALGFARAFLHPDGSFGGEYGSRNTCQVLASGWESRASGDARARALADGWLRGAIAGRRGYSDDDRIVSHVLHDYLDAWRHRRARDASTATTPIDPAAAAADEEGVTSFPAAHLHVVRAGELSLFLATNKGGTFRAHRGERCIASDTGLVVCFADGSRGVMHAIDPAARVRWEPGAVEIEGVLHRSVRRLATPWHQIAFRLFNASVGRAAPDLQRRALQKLLITGKKPLPIRFVRRIAWTEDGSVTVRDRLAAAGPLPRVTRVLGSTDATSIYVATSNVWQQSSLEPWTEHEDAAASLRATGRAEVLRRRS